NLTRDQRAAIAVILYRAKVAVNKSSRGKLAADVRWNNAPPSGRRELNCLTETAKETGVPRHRMQFLDNLSRRDELKFARVVAGDLPVNDARRQFTKEQTIANLESADAM